MASMSSSKLSRNRSLAHRLSRLFSPESPPKSNSTYRASRFSHSSSTPRCPENSFSDLRNGFSYFSSCQANKSASNPFSRNSESRRYSFMRFYCSRRSTIGFSPANSRGLSKSAGILFQKNIQIAKNEFNYMGLRSFFSGRVFVNGDFGSLFDKPVQAARSVFVRYREAIGLHIEAFWNRNYIVFVGAVGVAVCIILWRVMFGVASTFVGFSEGMAKYGFLALASAIVAFAGIYVRSRFTLNPDKIYRMAMRKLNTSAGILEVMGAPLSGTDLRAYVISGGGFRMKKFRPRISNKRCFLIFPVRGSERKGLVSVEVKKKKGQYDLKLLAVDIPIPTGADQRLFLVGDEEEYHIGNGLISELRDPLLKAMASEKEFETLDEKEEEEDAERELQEEERKRQEEIEKLEKGSS